jgi:hypothetical protein
MTGARTVVEILRAADLIGESDGKITALADADRPPDQEGPGEPRVEEHVGDRTVAVKQTVLRVGGTGAVVGVQVNIELQVRCSPDELEGMGEKIRRVVEAITSVSTGTASEGDSGKD